MWAHAETHKHTQTTVYHHHTLRITHHRAHMFTYMTLTNTLAISYLFNCMWSHTLSVAWHQTISQPRIQLSNCESGLEIFFFTSHWQILCQPTGFFTHTKAHIHTCICANATRQYILMGGNWKTWDNAEHALEAGENIWRMWYVQQEENSFINIISPMF